jgi:hypothetical protein
VDAVVPSGWTGNNVSIINGVVIGGSPRLLPFDGDQFVELDGNGTLSQSFAITEARKYFLHWFDSSDFNSPSASPLYTVGVIDNGGKTVATNSFDADPAASGFWRERTMVLDLAPGAYKLTFFGSANQSPAPVFLDDVSISGTSYAVFTDDLGLPVKFAPLPFSDSSPLRGLTFSNSFEGAVAGPYNTTFDGWTVDSGSVTVITDPPTAADGNNYLRTGNGVISRTLPTSPGRSYRLSFAYKSQVGNQGTIVTLIGSRTNQLEATSTLNAWATFSADFVADQTNMVLRFSPPILNGLDLDYVLLEDTGTVFLNPEEPLSILEGERAMGEWKLEAIDNRTGATVPSVLQEWQLILDTANPARLAEPMTRGQVYPTLTNNPVIIVNSNVYTPGRIIGGETEWFYYDVCLDATKVSLKLATPSGNTVGMQLLVDRSGFPTGDPYRDDYTIMTVNPGDTKTFEIFTNSPAAAPLIQGKRIFFAVRADTFPATTNETFTLQLTSDGTCLPVLPIALAPGANISSMAFVSSAGDDSSTIFQTTTIGGSTVQISADGTLTLLASNGIDPMETNYQLKQTVSSGSATLTLPTAGTWHLRVVNNTSATIPYTISIVSNVRNVAIAGNQLQVTFATVAGVSYEVATSTDLVNWTPVTTLQGTGSDMTYTDPSAATATARFIRIRAL